MNLSTVLMFVLQSNKILKILIFTYMRYEADFKQFKSLKVGRTDQFLIKSLNSTSD